MSCLFLKKLEVVSRRLEAVGIEKKKRHRLLTTLHFDLSALLAAWKTIQWRIYVLILTGHIWLSWLVILFPAQSRDVTDKNTKWNPPMVGLYPLGSMSHFPWKKMEEGMSRHVRNLYQVRTDWLMGCGLTGCGLSLRSAFIITSADQSRHNLPVWEPPHSLPIRYRTWQRY